MINPDERLTILANKNVSRGKMSAAAVHAALMHYGIPHGAVIVLGASPGRIEDECSLIIRDAGRTEVEPGTVTAGVRKGENDAQHHALLDAATELAHMREARDNARAEVERLAGLVATVREWIDRRGVNVDDRDDEYMRGYRAAQRHALMDTLELRRALDEGGRR